MTKLKARLGENWQTILDTAPLPIGRVTQATAVGIPTGAAVPVPCPTIDFLTGGIVATSGGLQIPVNGIYWFSFSLGSMTSGGNNTFTGNAQISLMRNQSLLQRAVGSYSNAYPALISSDMTYCEAGQTLTIQVSQTSTGNAYCDPTTGNARPCALSVRCILPIETIPRAFRERERETS